MRRAAWCAGVGGDEAFCRVSGHVLRRRATSERGGSWGGWDWGDWGWGEDPASSGIGIGVIGVGARAHLGRAPREGDAWCAGVGGGRSSWCLVPCVTQCLVRRGVTSNSHGRGVRTSPHTSDVRP